MSEIDGSPIYDFITYGEGGIDRTIPTRNCVLIRSVNIETEEEIYSTEDASEISKLWELSDANAHKINSTKGS